MNALRTLIWTLLGFLATLAGTMGGDVRPTQAAASPTGTIRRHARAITTGKRFSYRAIKRIKVAESTSTRVGARSNNQIDQAADTSCAGRNWRLIGPSGTFCTVSGFSNELGSVEQVEIGTHATAWIHPLTFRKYILLLHESLSFRSLDNSLINPNQVRHNGLKLNDNPWDVDEERPFGIKASDVFIPFDSEGPTIYFETCFPSDQELAECLHIELTSDASWDPSEVRLPTKSIPWARENAQEFTNKRFLAQVAMNKQAGVHRDCDRYESDLALSSIADVYTE